MAFNFFFFFYFLYIKMSKDSSARYYKKKGFKKNLVKGIKIILKKTKNKKWEYGHKQYKDLLENKKTKTSWI